MRRQHDQQENHLRRFKDVQAGFGVQTSRKRIGGGEELIRGGRVAGRQVEQRDRGGWATTKNWRPKTYDQKYQFEVGCRFGVRERERGSEEKERVTSYLFFKRFSNIIRCRLFCFMYCCAERFRVEKGFFGTLAQVPYKMKHKKIFIYCTPYSK
jgi:hypothetical protein